MAAVDDTYEYIVVGCGGVGSATAYWLASRVGAKVLGIEQFELGHHNGGSQDVSRIISRLMYHDVKYTKLTPHTFTAFEEVEKESGLQLVYRCGSLDFARLGTEGAQIIKQFEQAMDKENIRYDRYEGKALCQRYPQIVAEDLVGLVQPDGGLVDAALSNSVHVQLARARGATFLENTPVTRVETHSDGTATVFTTKGNFRCRRVIVTAGAWTNQVLGSVGVHIPICVTQEQVTYYATPHIKKFTKDNFPSFIYHGEENKDLYGLPIHVNSGTKIGIDAGGPEVTADTRNFEADPVREAKCEDFLKRVMPDYLGPKLFTKTCLYAMTYDRDFVIDTLARKGKPQIVFCQGAGHVFKFSSLFGRVLTELAVDGRTQYPIQPFTMDRPAITDPTFPKLCMDYGMEMPQHPKL